MNWFRTLRTLGLPLLLFPSLVACQHNFSHINMVFSEPTIDFDPDISIKTRHTFAVIPNEELGGQQASMAEKQILYLVAVALEGSGYEHVAPAESPDLLLTVGFSNEYWNVRIPPSVSSVPVYYPGDRITTHGYVSGYSPNSGAFYGSGVAVTTTPGSWRSKLRVSQGYDIGAYSPSVAFTLWDPVTRQGVWSGSSRGATYTNPNLSVTAPFVLLKICEKLPMNEVHRRKLLESEFGFVNAVTWPLTRDGTVYYPTVINMPARCAARTAGLRLWDMIVEIDGRSTANVRAKMFEDFEEMSVGEKLRFKVRRLNRVLDLQVPMEPLAPEYRTALRGM